MNRNNDPLPTLSLDTQVDENRMRRALGLQGGGSPAVHQQRPEQARQRHRFAQDGSVPVVVLNRSGDAESGGAKERIASLEAALETERAAHAGTKRHLQEAQAAQQALQTRLAHTELAHSEALGVERQARRAAEEALAAAQAALPPPPKRVAAAAEPVVPKVRKPRANAAPPREPKPVRWWTPSFRAKKK